MKEIDWSALTFSYTETDYAVRCSYKDRNWGPLRVTTDKSVTLHAASTALQYGQQVFEGLKAFRGVDGKVRVFRMEDNARRMYESAMGVYMQPVPDEIFCNAIRLCVEKNQDWIPPYESGATLYLRPILIGTTPRIGVSPSSEYEFIVLATPIGPYFPCGFGTTPFIVYRRVDRAAPFGTGKYKVGGNYAASFRATEPAHHAGMGALFLDATEHKYIDECGGANFFGIKDGVYVTPKSDSILPSITNRSLMTLCKDMGIPVEARQLALTELSNFQEAASCGTGAAISPISKIIDVEEDQLYSFGAQPGPVCQKLYTALQDIQYGRVEDIHGWNTEIQL